MVQQASAHVQPSAHPLNELDEVQQRWLRRPDPLGGLLTAGLYWANWMAMRTLFRLRVEGREHLPADGPIIITPNHSSSLDSPALAASLPLSLLQETYWIARKGAIFRDPIRRAGARIAHAMPVDRDGSALTAAAAVLRNCAEITYRIAIGRFLRFGNTAMHAGCIRSGMDS